MPALRVVFVFLVAIFTLVSCSDDSESSNVKNEDKEALPNVDTKLFRKVKGDGFTLSVLKEMSENRVSGTLLYDADYLPKEYHFSIKKTPIAQFKKDNSFPGKMNAQLDWFAKHESKKIEGRLRESKATQFEKVAANGMTCFKQTISGKEYGFPLTKTYFLRFIHSKNNFYTISAWTVEKEVKVFENLAQYMGMTFEITH